MHLQGIAPLFLAIAALAQQPTFEVASIKVSDPPPERRGGTSVYTTDGGFRAVNIGLINLITMALKAQRYQVSGEPTWVKDAHYDITAKNADAEEKDIPAKDMSRQEAKAARMRARVLHLLQTRFQLALKEETKELPVYALVIDKSGLKVKETEAKGNVSQNSGNGAGSIKAEGVNLERLAITLASILGRPVINETGLDGTYDFELKYSLDNSSAAQEKALEEVTGPSIFTALRESAGLRLVGKKGPVQTWVIEKIEHPSEN